MTKLAVFFHELKTNRISLIAWSCVIAFMLGISIIIYPEMGAQMDGMGDMFAQMGAFTEAFGMDQVNFGEFKGYYAVECGNVLGLGGAIFAAILGITSLAKEEKDGTAEFLLSHPISRKRVISEKLLAIVGQIVLLNVFVMLVSLAAMLAIGEKIELGTFLLITVSYFIMQIEIASITFGVSAFSLKGGFGIGLGISMMLYFMNILSNLTDDLKFLKYITPFGYADGTAIVSDNSIQFKYVAIGLVLTLIGVCVAFAKYTKKDIK